MTIGDMLRFIEVDRKLYPEIDSYVICTVSQTVHYCDLSRDTVIVVDHERAVVIVQTAEDVR